MLIAIAIVIVAIEEAIEIVALIGMFVAIAMLIGAWTFTTTSTWIEIKSAIEKMKKSSRSVCRNSSSCRNGYRHKNHHRYVNSNVDKIKNSKSDTNVSIDSNFINNRINRMCYLTLQGY